MQNIDSHRHLHLLDLYWPPRELRNLRKHLGLLRLLHLQCNLQCVCALECCWPNMHAIFSSAHSRKRPQQLTLESLAPLTVQLGDTRDEGISGLFEKAERLLQGVKALIRSKFGLQIIRSKFGLQILCKV